MRWDPQTLQHPQTEAASSQCRAAECWAACWPNLEMRAQSFSYFIFSGSPPRPSLFLRLPITCHFIPLPKLNCVKRTLLLNYFRFAGTLQSESEEVKCVHSCIFYHRFSCRKARRGFTKEVWKVWEARMSLNLQWINPGKAAAVSQSDLHRNKPIKSPLNWLLVVSTFHINILSLCSAVYACS